MTIQFYFYSVYNNMDNKFLQKVILLSCVYFIHVESNSEQPTCTVNFKDCSYHYQLMAKTGEDCPTTPEDINSQPDAKKVEEDTEKLRGKRSVESLQVESTEFHKMKRRLQRVEQNLSKSMESLSSRVLRGVRRMEDTLTSIMGGQTKRYAENPSSHSACPAGFQDMYSDKSCYMFSSFNTTWFDAKQFCEAFDSALLALDNIKEHNLITFIIKNSPAYSQSVGWWTSGTFIEKTKQWMWISAEMQPFTFIKWADNEPNEENLQCVYLNKDFDHLWHDAMCATKFNFVCEKHKV